VNRSDQSAISGAFGEAMELNRFNLFRGFNFAGLFFGARLGQQAETRLTPGEANSDIQ
jgi:hypothetical protein